MKTSWLTLLTILILLSACNLPVESPTPTTSEEAFPTPALDDTPSILPTSTLPLLDPTATPVTCPPFGLVEKSLPANPQSTDFIGYSYLDIPAGFDQPIGWLIDSGNPAPDGLDYALVVITGLPRDFLAFIQIPCNVPDGKAYYIIQDVLDFPAPEENAGFGSGETTCTLNGEVDYELVPVSRSHPEDMNAEPDPSLGYRISDILRVYRANRDTHKYEEIPLDGVACYFQVMGD